MKTKDGKIVISSKADQYFKPLMEVPVGPGQSRFEVPLNVKKQIDQAGYEMRFINEREYVKNSNTHERDWLPYREDLFSTEESITSSMNGIGISADGYLRRGDTVLAVRPRARGDQYRAIIKERNRRQAERVKTSQQNLREEARRAGFGTESVED
jgi:hypothetical protein